MTRRILASRVILIATPDDEVAVVAQELARIGEEELRGRVVLHTSGAMDSAVLDAVHERSAMGGSMHPLQSFSGASVHRWKARFLQWKGKRMRSGWRGRSRERLADRPCASREARKSCITRLQRWPPVMYSPWRKPPCSCSSRLG
ncbi:MAG: hypothetical protein DMG50_15485 [Acidobacteria bacterium]|nr:MAG: hypothetical protein DMG50_15485 [Acidobacteriota bacterium]